MTPFSSRIFVAVALICVLVSAGPTSAQLPLPFDQASIKSLRDSKRKVFAHYFTQFPRSLDNHDPASDYYAKGYIDPAGEGGKWLKVGGFLRQRPVPRAPMADKGWPDRDMETEVKLAAALGIDGFTVDLLGAPTMKNYHWSRTMQLARAAAKIDPGFKIIPMPDMTAGYAHNKEALTTAITELAALPSIYKLADGRVVVSPYCAQTDPPEWWAEWIAEMKAKGIDIAFLPLFQNWRAYVEKYKDVSIGASDWGLRTVGANAKWFGDAAQFAHKSVPIWMAPVSFQDYRPKDTFGFEASNSANYRTMWMNAIDGGADWVQLITWNDYSECTEITPSTGTQWSVYDLTAYYTAWFKTGKMPKIKRDVLYYFHRVESTEAPYDADKQVRKTSLATGSDPFVNEIELLAFLTKPGKIEIEVGGHTQSLDAKAGMTSMRVPLAPGTPHFRLIRGGKAEIDFASAFEIVASAPYQDFLYRGGSNTRPPVDYAQQAPVAAK
ncbi:MAG TPA: glycoside hydrolase family 71 protein [Capsulimonadaceae bacterium]|jgi:hypothetical protein